MVPDCSCHPAEKSISSERSSFGEPQAGVLDVNTGRAFWERSLDGKGRHLALVVGRNLSGLRQARCSDGDFVEVDFEGVQRNAVAGLGEVQIDGLVAFEAIAWEVDGEGQRVVVRNGATRKALRYRGTAHEQAS